MWRSEVPPPEASRPAWWGDQASALTAAVCCRKRQTGGAAEPVPGAHTATVLSLPPLASCALPGAHCMPATSHSAVKPNTPIRQDGSAIGANIPEGVDSSILHSWLEGRGRRCAKRTHDAATALSAQQNIPPCLKHSPLLLFNPVVRFTCCPVAKRRFPLSTRGRWWLRARLQSADLRRVADEADARTRRAHVCQPDGAVPAARRQHRAAPGQRTHAPAVLPQLAHCLALHNPRPPSSGSGLSHAL